VIIDFFLNVNLIN